MTVYGGNRGRRREKLCGKGRAKEHNVPEKGLNASAAKIAASDSKIAAAAEGFVAIVRDVFGGGLGGGRRTKDRNIAREESEGQRSEGWEGEIEGGKGEEAGDAREERNGSAKEEEENKEGGLTARDLMLPCEEEAQKLMKE